ncbi:hypothetical protein IL306_002543 [Fusarium sp. DS 682]|nr:hypothetical protein IL306_002543 [Fusarium sp. DS 682]
MAPANLIICFDGTANSEYIKGNPLTNVSRLRRSIVNKKEDGETRQIVHYQGGIGTGYGNPFNILRKAVGDELERIIIRAYTFLCDNYHLGCNDNVEHTDNASSKDKIFLIGFSRGAFAARCLADLVHWHGVLPKKKMDNIPELYRHWSDPTKRSQTLPDDFQGTPAQITACALWDTVSALGVPLPLTTLLRGLPFIHSDIPDSVQHVFQALALHEHRHHFFPLILRRPAGESNRAPQLEQCWFAGYHADVGGGNERDALAHFALVWIMMKLEKWIEFKKDRLFDRLTPQTTWKANGPVVAYRREDGWFARLRITDPMYWWYILGGSKYRIPQTELWNEHGVYMRKHDTNDDVSREKIHPTARYLAQAKLVKECHCAERLNPPQPEQNNELWVWNLRSKAKWWWWRLFSRFARWLNWSPGWLGGEGGEGNKIHEDKLDDREKEKLINWIESDHQYLDGKKHTAGEMAPGTVLVHLRSWLENYMDEAVPDGLRIEIRQESRSS